MNRLLIVFALALAGIAQTPAKRPLNHRDYDAWKTIAGQALSRDGKFLAYSSFPEEGDGEIVVRNLATGKEVRDNAGVQPPVVENPEAEGPVSARAPQIGFTADGKFLISTAFPKK